MATDHRKIFSEPLCCVITAIGELCLFPITFGGIKEFHKELDKPINEYDSKIFLRKYIRYICFPKNSLEEGKYKPKNYVLADKDISLLSDDDLESIAKLYINNNEYLYRKLIINEKPAQKGTTITREYGEVEYPKEENESYIDYLLRLNIKLPEKMGNVISKSVKGMMSDFSSFSNTVRDGIINTLSLGDSLRKTMEGIKPLPGVSIKQVEPMVPNIDFSDVMRGVEAGRIKPFKGLSDRLDQLINASKQSTEFMIEANQIQTRIAGEIKSSGDKTTKFSKINIKLTCFVIFIAVLGLGVSIYTILRANNDGNMQRSQTQESVNLLAGKLTEIKNSISGANDSLKIENEHLKEQTTKQENMIEEMKIMIERQGTRLQEMENKLQRNDQ